MFRVSPVQTVLEKLNLTSSWNSTQENKRDTGNSVWRRPLILVHVILIWAVVLYTDLWVHFIVEAVLHMKFNTKTVAGVSYRVGIIILCGLAEFQYGELHFARIRNSTVILWMVLCVLHQKCSGQELGFGALLY